MLTHKQAAAAARQNAEANKQVAPVFFLPRPRVYHSAELCVEIGVFRIIALAETNMSGFSAES